MSSNIKKKKKSFNVYILYWRDPCFLSFKFCMSLSVLCSVLWRLLLFQHKIDVRSLFTPSCLLEDQCLIYVICVCLRIVESNLTHIVFFVCLRLVYHMLPVSLDCPLLIAPSVFSNV